MKFDLLGNFSLTLLIGAITPPIVSWIVYYTQSKRMKQMEDEMGLLYRKHNSMVMYFKGKGMSGWPEYENRLVLEVQTYNSFMEPLRFFLRTAQKNLEIAVMNISLQPLIDELNAILSRGVAVRIIVDSKFENTVLKTLVMNGAEVMQVNSDDGANIMHFKYAVKDYSSAPKKGCVVFGSLNWTQGIIENYENLFFSTKYDVVKSFHDNFTETWNNVLSLHENITKVNYILEDL